MILNKYGFSHFLPLLVHLLNNVHYFLSLPGLFIYLFIYLFMVVVASLQPPTVVVNHRDSLLPPSTV